MSQCLFSIYQLSRSSIALSYSHGEEELAVTEHALDQTFKVYGQALEDGFEKYLKGAVKKPVFRKFN